MPKTTAAASKRRHNPHEADLVSTGVLKNKTGKKTKNTRDDNDEKEQKYVDAKASRNILAMSRDLLEEEENLKTTSNTGSGSAPSAFQFDPSRFDRDDDEDDKFENDEAWGEEEEEVEEIEVDATDLETFNQFITPTMNEDPLLTHGWDRKPEGEEEQGQSVNLADLILAKIAEKEAGAPQGGYRDDEPGPVDEDYEIPPKVLEVFEK